MATKTTKTTSAKAPAVKKAAAVKKTSAKKVATPRSAAKTPSIPEGLDARIFNYPVNESLLAQVIHVYRTNSHQNTSKVQTRGEVNRTTKKVYKQKGTGNARHGARSAPIYVGGGVAHGPSGVKPANLKLNQKMKAAGLAVVLSLMNKDNRVELLSDTQIKRGQFTKPKTLLVYQTDEKPSLLAVRNLKNLELSASSNLNPYTVANSQNIVFTAKAHETLVARLLPLLKLKAAK